jgi:DNA-binding CsgD family transcriptional regulator
LRLFRDVGDRWGIARGLHTLGRLAASIGEDEQAARLYVASSRLRDTIGAPPRLTERPAYESDLAAVRARLGEIAFAEASAAGQSLSLDGAIEHARTVAWPAPRPAPSRPAGPGPGQPATPLTRRELEVAALIAEGLTNRSIAERLVISEWTVDSHVRHILSKLDVRSRAQVATWAAEQGLAPPSSG